MVGHEYTTSTPATPITIATTMKTRSRVIPRNTRSVGFLPNSVVTHSRLRRTTPRSDTVTCCCMHPPFHNAQNCLPGRVNYYSSRNYSQSIYIPVAQVEMANAPGERLLAIDTCIACRTATHYGFDLCLVFRDKILWERYILERGRVLLAIMSDPPEHIRDSLPFARIRLVLIDYRPGEAC